MNLKLIVIFTFFASFVCEQISAKTEKWRNARGKIIEAELLDANAEGVLFKIRDKEFRTPWDRIHPEDAKKIQKIVSEREKHKSTDAFEDLKNNIKKSFVQEIDNATAVLGDKLKNLGKNFTSKTGATVDSKSLEFEDISKKDWPRTTRLHKNPKFEIVEEDSEKKSFIYRSDNFEFFCNDRLSHSVVNEFSQIFEGELLAVKSLPLKLEPSPPYQKEFYKAKFYLNEEDYVANGAPANSGGYYQGKLGLIHVPLSNLGVKFTGVRFIIDRGADNSTLVHEVGHQLTHRLLRHLPPWISEGFAEYIAHSYDKAYVFEFQNTLRKGVRHIVKRRSNKLTLPKPSEMMLLSDDKWSEILADDSETAGKNYDMAFLMFAFFTDIAVESKNSRQLLYEYLLKLESGVSEKTARRELLLDFYKNGNNDARNNSRNTEKNNETENNEIELREMETYFDETFQKMYRGKSNLRIKYK